MRLALRPYYKDRKLKALHEAKPPRGQAATEPMAAPDAPAATDVGTVDDVAGAA
jgi:hypothetical protein